jgi:hypothetical protein
MLTVFLYENQNSNEMRIPIQVKVHPVVREFIVSTTGSHVIEPIPNSNFFFRIKTILQLNPKEYKNYPLKNESTITIIVTNFHLGRDNYIYGEHRNHLDDRRQYFLSKELYDGFKSIFHNYVLAYLRGGGKQQKQAIEDFCLVYNISLENINYEMLKKSWDRSEQKKMLKNYPTPCPLKKINL